LLAQKRYQEAADTFMKITELNSWSVDRFDYLLYSDCALQESRDILFHRCWLRYLPYYPYHTLMAGIGCYFSMGNYEKAQAILGMVPELIEKRKIDRKYRPTEVFIKKKRECLFLTLSYF
jgi:tetratricopeptide (TPR) repeat protein